MPSLHDRTAAATAARTRGFTLIEFMIVIALIATATLAVLGYKALAKNDSDTANETNNVAVLSTKMPKLKAAGSYGAKDADLIVPLIALGGVPASMSIVGNKVTNAWGGAVTVLSTGAGYKIQYAKLPKGACVSMALGISGGADDVTTSLNGATGIKGPVSAAQAAAGCSADENTLAWTYTS
ncbi:type 4 pilus major pilin [Pinirhizobacter soli]|uniref:type 4 pilus major pilin n=1 Tax=Pinirhizobacter soli TaxID=2786953 RepID=UPI002029D915|nr:type 4 pilus major pilin [Pinirhizobacter soli]